MKQILSIDRVEFIGQRYDIEIEDTHCYVADGLLVHNCCLPKDTKLANFPWKTGVFSQVKADGMFANINHDLEGVVSITSRNGSPFPLDQFLLLVKQIKKNVPKGMQCHGELLMSSGASVLNRQEGNGMFNKLLQGGELPKGHTPVYECWDMIPIKEAKAKNKYKVPYKDRFAMVQKAFAEMAIECRMVYSLKEAYEHYKDALDRGLEGVVVKHPDMIWEDTTSKNQVKLKLEAQCELRIVGFNPGTGKNKDLFGSFKCESEDGKLKCNVTGLSDDMRVEAMDWNGKVITVTSNSIMPPANKDYYSLFLPRFEELRLDKKKADSLQKIQDQFDAAIAAVGA